MEIAHEEQGNLVAIIETIDSILQIEVNAEDGGAISAKIGQLAALVATSSTAVALAELIYNQKLGKVLLRLPNGMSATDKKLILTGELSKEKYWVTQAERQNAALVHAIDGYRSMLSYLKEEIKMNSMYNPNPQ